MRIVGREAGSAFEEVIIVAGGFVDGKLNTSRPFWATVICQIEIATRIIPTTNSAVFFLCIAHSNYSTDEDNGEFLDVDGTLPDFLMVSRYLWSLGSAISMVR